MNFNAGMIRLLSCCLWALLAQSAKSDPAPFDPIPAADWNARPPEGSETARAYVLEEHWGIDDRKMDQYKCFNDLYRRVLILDSQASEVGDFSLPPLGWGGKVKSFSAQTTTPGGLIAKLTQDDLRETEVYKSVWGSVKQHAFSMPALTDGCIVEYRCRLRRRKPPELWNIQADIPIRDLSVSWLFHPDLKRRWTEERRVVLEGEIAPNYFSSGLDPWLQVHYLPQEGPPTSVEFTLAHLPGFKEEEYTLATAALRGKLMLFYSDGSTPAEFWTRQSLSELKVLEKEIDRSRRLRDVARTIEPAGDLDARIRAAYEWVQSTITILEPGTTAFEGKKVYLNETLDDVLAHRYGSADNRNLALWAIFRQLGIEARMAHLVPTDEGLFLPAAKVWQTTTSAVAVPNSEQPGSFTFYFPGVEGLPCGDAPPECEGVQALLVGDKQHLFTTVPVSPALKNGATRYVNLALDVEASRATGTYREVSKGHQGNERRRMLLDGEESSLEELESLIKAGWPEVNPTNLSFEDLGRGAFKAECDVVVDLDVQALGKRRILDVDALIPGEWPQLPDVARVHSIAFSFAGQTTDVLTMELSPGWEIAEFPTDSKVVNRVGACQIRYLKSGSKISVQRLVQLNSPFWAAADYGDVAALFNEVRQQAAASMILQEIVAEPAKEPAVN